MNCIKPIPLLSSLPFPLLIPLMVSSSLLTSVFYFALSFVSSLAPVLWFSSWSPLSSLPHSHCRCGCCTALRRKQNRCSKLLGQLVRPAPLTCGSWWVRLCPSWAWPDYPTGCLQSDHRAGGTSPADVSPVGCPFWPMELSHYVRTTEQLEGRTLSLTVRWMATEHRGSAVEWSKKHFFLQIQDVTCMFCTERDTTCLTLSSTTLSPIL